MKILCVCQGGNSRSVTMAYVLKKKGYDALSCGWRDNSPETIDMLFRWADLIIAMHGRAMKRIPAQYQDKTKLCDVGSDRWLKLSSELIGMCNKFWEEKGV